MVKETRKDRVIGRLRLLNYSVLKGRELLLSTEFLPYERVKDQLKIIKDCLLKANRVIFPIKPKDNVASENDNIWVFRKQNSGKVLCPVVQY